MTNKKTSDLDPLEKPTGSDFIPTLDIDGGKGGKAKLKKLSIAKLSSLISGTITGLGVQDSYLSSNDYFVIGESWQFSFNPGQLAALLKVVCNVPSRLRLYTSSQSRSVDFNRSASTDVDNESGLLFECIFATDLLTINCNPVALMHVPGGEVFVNIQPYNSSPLVIQLQFSTIPILV